MDIRDLEGPIPKEHENRVLHAEMFISAQRFMMSDSITYDSSQSANTACTLTAVFDSADEVKKAFDVLKDGSTIIVPMHSTTYSSCHVSLIDKFGIRWSLMTESTK